MRIKGRKLEKRKVQLRNERESRRGTIVESLAGSSGSEFEPKEWDPQVARGGGSLREVSFIRACSRTGAERKEPKEDAPPEVWLSLWDYGKGRLGHGGLRSASMGGKSGEEYEIRLGDRDIGRKHTGLRVDKEGACLDH